MTVDHATPPQPLTRSIASLRGLASPTADGHAENGTIAFRLTRRFRGRHLLIVDLIGIAGAAYAATAIRHEQFLDPASIPGFTSILLVLLAVRTLVDVRLGLYRRYWAFASVPDLQRIVLATIIGTSVAGTLVIVATWLGGAPWAAGFPLSFWILELLLSTAVLGGVRFGIRATSDRSVRDVSTRADRRALLYGAGHAGVAIARMALRQRGVGLQPVGFLDDDPKVAGAVIAGLRVFGDLSVLERAVNVTGASTVLVTMPTAPGSAVRRVVDAALALGLEVRTVPSIGELLDGSLDANRIRNVRLEDLVRRPIVTNHLPQIDEIIGGRTVLITGAGGSIGSELARQVYSLAPRRVILIDRAETPLFSIQQELETSRGRQASPPELGIHLANVANRAAMMRLIQAERPDVIFHAAAYKHVPMMEEHPSDAVHVNIGGTLAVLDAAEAAGVPRFVFVSTDKAVRPSSVMGASKRVAEMLVADAACRTGRAYVSVRFGNVLGSTGSVVPIFQDQLERGRPLTITHPDMTRFFMTIPEASWLILEAAAMGRSGDLFVLDMGEPVRVMDLARDLVRLTGRDPETTPIEVIGLRPGEKLHEELFYASEQVERTESPKVLRAAADAPPATVRDDVRSLLTSATGEDEHGLSSTLLEYARRLEHTRQEPGSDRVSRRVRSVPEPVAAAAVAVG